MMTATCEFSGANLPELLERTEPDLVIYNAGVDPFKDDPLGN